MKTRKAINIVHMRCRWFRWFFLLLFMCGLNVNAIQYVVPGGAGNQDGSSWANARADVQAAIDAAVLPGEEVWVAAGRYELTETVALRSDSVVLGGFVGTENVASQRDWDTNVTVLDGGGAVRVVSMFGITSAQLDGFVVTRGFFVGELDSGGGGILIESSKDCKVVNCKILHNVAEKASGVTGNTRGGGIFMFNGTNCVIEACLFTDNVSKSQGLSLAISCSEQVATHARVTRCRFVGTAQSGGLGTIYIIKARNVELSNCLVSGNTVTYGGFFCSFVNSTDVINCTACFTKNEHKGYSGTFWSNTSVKYKNNILAFNNPVGVEESTPSAHPFVYTNLFYAQTGADYYDNGDEPKFLTGAVAINNNTTPSGRASGNVDGDPRFVRCPTVDDGTWTSVGTYDADRAQTTLVDETASFRPGSLKGCCLNPNTGAEGEKLYRHAEIADNTATSITVWGEVTWAVANNGYRIYDYRLRQDSAAINAGDLGVAPAIDLDGNPRPALGGIDIGAYEAQPLPGTVMLLR